MALARRPEGHGSDEEDEEGHDAEGVDQLEERVAVQERAGEEGGCERIDRGQREHQCAPLICRRGRSATGGARRSTAAMPPASRSRSGESGPGTPSCGQLPAKGREEDRCAQGVRGVDAPHDDRHRNHRDGGHRRQEVRRGSVGLPGGHGGQRGDGERHRAGPDDRRPRRRSCTHHGPRRRSREARSSASASPAAIPPSRPTKTRICSIRERSLVGVDAGEKTSTPTLEVPPWTAV